MITKKLIYCYRHIMNVVLVLLLIAGPIAGGIIGKELSTYRANYTMIGIFIGLLAVLIFDFLIMPPVMVLFEINKKLSDKEKTTAKSNNIKEETQTKPEKESGWLCSKCGNPNDPDAKSCSVCFANK